MHLDFEDLLGSSLGKVVSLFLFFISVIWVGSAVGGVATLVPDWKDGYFGRTDDLWTSPMLLLNEWLLLNVAILAATLAILMLTDAMGYGAWGFLAGMESLFVVAGWTHAPWSRLSTGDLVLGWSAWVVLLLMMETGVWLVRQMRTTHWARQLALLKAENAMRHAEREASLATGEDDATEEDEESLPPEPRA